MSSDDAYNTFSSGSDSSGEPSPVPGDKRPVPDDESGSNWSETEGNKPEKRSKLMRKSKPPPPPLHGLVLWRRYMTATGIVSSYDPDTVTLKQLTSAIEGLETVIQGGPQHEYMAGFLQGRADHFDGTDAGEEWADRCHIVDQDANNEQFTEYVVPAFKALKDLAKKHESRVINAAKIKPYAPTGAVYGPLHTLGNSSIAADHTMAELDQVMFRPRVVRARHIRYVAGQELAHVQSRWGRTHGNLYDALGGLADEPWSFQPLEHEMYLRE